MPLVNANIIVEATRLTYGKENNNYELYVVLIGKLCFSNTPEWTVHFGLGKNIVLHTWTQKQKVNLSNIYFFNTTIFASWSEVYFVGESSIYSGRRHWLCQIFATSDKGTFNFWCFHQLMCPGKPHMHKEQVMHISISHILILLIAESMIIFLKEND